MRNNCFVFLVAIATVGCGLSDAKKTTSDSASAQPTSDLSSQPKQSTVTPRLWLDQDAATMIRVVAGYDNPEDLVFVVRWEHGTLGGWAKLNSPDGANTISFDLGVPTEPSQTTGMGDLTGWIVIAMRKQPNSSREEYEVRIEEQFTLHVANSTETRGFDSRSGTLIREPAGAVANARRPILSRSNEGRDGRFELIQDKDGQDVPWLSVNLRSSLSEPNASAEFNKD
jgi:hypothetical protein